MTRRKTKNVTGIKGTGAVDYSAVWWIFQCGNRICSNMLKISEDQPGFPVVVVQCTCGRSNGKAEILKGSQWKYCRVCEQLQPVERFDRHKPKGQSFRSGRQLECKACKKTINAVLNPKRTADQHREAAQRRRLYSLLAGEQAKIDSLKVFKRFKGKCFNCDASLRLLKGGRGDFRLDHTLPAKYLWPLTTKNATLLCDPCNNAKHDKWPSEFYKPSQLKPLAVLADLSFDLLSGPPKLNPDALARLLGDVDGFLAKWIPYPDEIKGIHDLVLKMDDTDICSRAHVVPTFLEHD